MNERQRMQYLEAMGIDCFVPRFSMPQAKVSVACELPIANDGVNRRVETETADSAVDQVEALQRVKKDAQAHQQSVPAIASVLSESPEKPTESTATPKSSIQSILDVIQAPAPEQVSFNLALWHIGHLQVIDSRQSGDALPTDSLLSNILLSFGCLDTQLPRVERIDWPMVQTAQDKSWQAAREMVQGFLDGRLLSKPVSHFLLFGQDACHAILGEDSDFLSACYTTVSIEAYDAHAIVLPSLAEILRDAQLKYKVWVALKTQLM